MGSGRDHTGPKQKQTFRTGTEISKENMLAVALLSEKPVLKFSMFPYVKVEVLSEVDPNAEKGGGDDSRYNSRI